jgi:type I restriction enzyme, R subunit
MPLSGKQLEKIVNRRREDRVAAASALERLRELEALAAQVPNARAGRSENASRLEGTAGRILPFVSDTLPPDTREAAASDIAVALEGYASFVDWQQKEDVQRQMRRAIKERLRSVGVSRVRSKLPPQA